MKRTIINSLFIVLIFISACKSPGEGVEQKYVKLVKTAEVVEVSSLSQKQFPGIVEEAEEVNLAFRVAGPIQNILVKEGDYVEEGQLVAVMDPRDYEVQQKAASTQVKQLQSEYERVAELKRRNGVSANDYEKMKAGKEMAESQLDNANDQLADTKLYAPFSGYITKVNFKNREMVNHGTAIASIIDVSLLKVEIKVPASLYIYRDSISEFKCTQEDIPDEVYPLELYGNNIKANNNGLYKLYLYHKPEPSCLLAPGMNISVSVSYNSKQKTHLRIPLQAVSQSSEGDFVWVVSEDLKVAKRFVMVASDVTYGMVTVIHGIEVNERVVIGGLHQLREGESVRLVPATSPTNIGNLL